MNKLILFLILFFLPFKLLPTDCIPDCETDTDWTLEVRLAYYHLSSSVIKKIYTDDWLDFQVETAKRIHPFLEVWGGVCWASKQGHTRRAYGSYDYEFRDRTRMSILPLSLGLKLIYAIFPHVDAYAGIGICYTFLKIKNFCKEHYSDWGLSHSPFTKGIYKNDFGAVFKVGFHYAMSDSTFLDFFADYFSQSFRFSDKRGEPNRNIFNRNLNCSGFKFGAGFGVYF